MPHIPGAATFKDGSIYVMGTNGVRSTKQEPQTKSSRLGAYEKEISFSDKRWGSARELTRNGNGPFDWLQIQWV